MYGVTRPRIDLYRNNKAFKDKLLLNTIPMHFLHKLILIVPELEQKNIGHIALIHSNQSDKFGIKFM